MALKGINVEDLPTDVLEEIFLFVRDRKVLRQVSRKFKDIVENSPKLMAKYAVNVSQSCLYVPSIAVSCPSYQALKLVNSKLNFEEFKWINGYKHKERIKSVHINASTKYGKYDKSEKIAIFIQSIMFNFSSLYELYLDLDEFWLDDYFSGLKLVSSDLSNLQKLTISCHEDRDINEVVSMFSELHSIKSFTLSCAWSTRFSETFWKLEEFNLDDYSEEETNITKFLISQKSTLRKLRINNFDLLEFTLKNLPDLEVLHTCPNNKFSNDLTVINNKLKCLTLYNFDGKNEELENILGSYSNLERLLIKMNEDEPEAVGPMVGIELNNLTHLWLDGLLSSVLLSVKMPNLKFLEISNTEDEDPYNFCGVPSENFKNLEKLSIECVWRMKELHNVLLRCPKLIFLNLGFFKDIKGSLNASMIDILLAHTHQLRYLGLLKDYQKMTPKKLQSQIHKKNIVVKFYDDFEAMMKDYWKIGHIGTDCYGMDILI